MIPTGFYVGSPLLVDEVSREPLGEGRSLYFKSNKMEEICSRDELLCHVCLEGNPWTRVDLYTLKSNKMAKDYVKCV